MRGHKAQKIAPTKPESSTLEVPVRVLKDRLSEYLRVVEAGSRVLVTSHGRALADLVPHREAGAPATPVPIRKATRPWGAVRLSRTRRGRTDLVSVLLEERRKR